MFSPLDYLGLLAREAAPIEFERPLLAARASGAPAADLADLEEIKVAALRVRALLERRRRREEELSGLYDTASDLRRVATALIALGRAGDGAGADELGYVGLLLADRRDVPGFVRGVLGPVLDYDQRRGTALVSTLEAYFGAAGGQARAAEVLHVHVNTVTQRLDRITTLLGVGWQDPSRALDLQLALRLHRLSS